jgi:DNA segregation ATPase FtsK/SpoIIIE, S-DNA-T family
MIGQPVRLLCFLSLRVMILAKRKRRGKMNKDHFKETIKFEILGLLLFTLAILSLAKVGRTGEKTILFFRFFWGNWDFIGVFWLIGLSIYFMVKRAVPHFFHIKLVGMYTITCAILILSHLNILDLMSNDGKFTNPSVVMNTFENFKVEWEGKPNPKGLGGGMIGAVLTAVSYYLFDEGGTKIITFLLIIIGSVLITGRPIGEFVSKVLQILATFLSNQWKQFLQDFSDWKTKVREKRKEGKAVNKQASSKPQEESKLTSTVLTQSDEEKVVHPEPIISSFTEKVYPSQEMTELKTNADLLEKEEEVGPPITFTEVENHSYELPPLHILNMPKQTDQSGEYELIHANAAKLERTFQSFGVKARVTQVHLGPAVTKYEVHPDVGVKVSKIVSLSDDLALALAAKDIRIEAPIPGKSAIGIEVPNSEVAMVSLREVLEAKQNDKPDSKLLIGLGRDITGEAVLAELNKMPHLLVAGATGSGKSVCINGIITSILMRAKPHEVKLMMIDPKMVELNVYNGIPHLLAPVVTDAKKASQALKKVVNEMERRYELFSHTGTRNIEGYNDYMRRINLEEGEKQPLLPYIVVIVDELADLMMVASSDVEDSITRLAQMARAAGIHLIIATQRPSVDVITGVIKANIPSRIAFAVSSQTDSRTILDMGGAEKLLGRGDMLFLPVGASKPIRVQGAFLSDSEVEDTVEFVIGQQKAQYQEEMIPEDIPEATGAVDDELYQEAVELIVEMQTASVSMLQRRFRIGYTRAARLIDEMEARGVVGPYEGSKPRVVLISKSKEEVSS